MSGRDVGNAVGAAVATLLGAAALAPVFASWAWLPPIAAVVLAVLAGGLLLRGAGPVLWSRLRPGRPAPRPVAAVGTALVPVGQLLLVLCLLTALYAPGEAVVGVLPTWSSLADLGGVFAEGTAEMREQATPALPLTGLLALTTVLVALVAVTVDLVAVTARRPAMAGVGLLVLYCVPVSTIVGGIGLVPTVAPAAGMALLLWIDQHHRLDLRDRPAGRLLGAGAGAALRIATAAVLAGVVVGSVLPTLAEGSLTTGLGGGSGSSTGTSLEPAAALHGELTLPEPRNLFSIQTGADDPGYLRSVVLDQYDPEEGWTLSNLDGQISVADTDRLAPLRLGQARRPISGTFTVLEHDDRFLPVLTSPQTVRMLDGGSDDWRFDAPTGTVFGRSVSTNGRSYWVSAHQPRPAASLLAEASQVAVDSEISLRFTALPELDPQVTALVEELTAGIAIGEPYERVRRIHAYLTDRSQGFVYSLSTDPGTGGDDLVDFLRLKRGYCEQYAGAMAVLVRAAGVPARVALGYTPGSELSDGTRLVTTDDAHAWVEVYFDDIGWVPFDPTPIGEDRASELPWAPRTTQNPEVELGREAPAPAMPSQPAPAPRQDRGGGGAAVTAPGQETASSLQPVLLTAGGTLLGLVVLVLPAGVRILQRRRRVADGRAGSLWDELGATATDLGLRLHPAWTPRRTAEELARVLGGPGATADPAAVDAVRRLAYAEEVSSYGPASDRDAGPELAGALRTVRRALSSARPRAVRLRALLWPASLVAAGPRLAERARTAITSGVGRRRSRRAARTV